MGRPALANISGNHRQTITSLFSHQAMLDWLKSQVRIVEAWREELARQPEIDIDTVIRVERHYAWLTGEVMRLES